MFLADLLVNSGPGTLFFARNSANAAQYIKIIRHSSLRLRIDVGGTIGEASAGEDRIPVWIWYRRSGNTHELYDNGFLIASVSVNVSGWTLDEVFLGTDTTTGNWKQCNYQTFREWNSALTAAQFRAEINSVTPVITSGLTCDTPLASDYADDSGNSSNWTAIGSPTFFTQGERLPLHNSTVDRTITVSEMNAARRIIFWTASPESRFVGYNVQRVGSDFPYLGVFEYTHSNLHRRDGWPTGWMKLEVDKVNTFVLEADSDVTADFQLHFEHAPDLPATIPVNSIIINDDTDAADFTDSGRGFPATVWTREGTFLGFSEVVRPSEIGAGTPSGHALSHDRYQHSGYPLNLISPSLTLISAFNLPGGDAFGTGTGDPFPRIASDGVNFYVLNATTQKVYKVTKSGAIYGPIATITTLNTTEKRNKAAIGVSRDGTVLYYTLGNAEGNIKRWNLATDTAMSDLYSIPGFGAGDSVAKTHFSHAGDIVVMDDDSIALWWFEAGIPAFTRLLHIDPSGTLLHTVSYSNADAGANSINHIGPSAGAGADKLSAWWIRGLGENNTARFSSSLEFTGEEGPYVFHAALMSGGIQNSDTSEAMFQPSRSCWFWVFRPDNCSCIYRHAHAAWY